MGKKKIAKFAVKILVKTKDVTKKMLKKRPIPRFLNDFDVFTVFSQ